MNPSRQRLAAAVLVAALGAVPAGLWAQSKAKRSAASKTSSRSSAVTNGKAADGQASEKLDSVLNRMDQASQEFKSAQANFTWDQYQAVVQDTDTQKGTIYFRRNGKDLQMMARITQPATKSVLYTGNKVRVYEPKIDQVTEYNTASRRADVDTFLVLGFGGGGHELEKSFEVSYAGNEKIDGVETEKLQLVPKSEKLRGTFQKIFLWIDPARGVSVRQQFLQPGGDRRDAQYSDIKINAKIPHDIFKLNTTSRTK